MNAVAVGGWPSRSLTAIAAPAPSPTRWPPHRGDAPAHHALESLSIRASFEWYAALRYESVSDRTAVRIHARSPPASRCTSSSGHDRAGGSSTDATCVPTRYVPSEEPAAPRRLASCPRRVHDLSMKRAGREVSSAAAFERVPTAALGFHGALSAWD